MTQTTAEPSNKHLRNGMFIGFILGITAAWILGDIARTTGMALALLTAHHAPYHLTAADEQAIADGIVARLTKEAVTDGR